MDVLDEVRTKLCDLTEEIAENENEMAKQVLKVNLTELSAGFDEILPPEPDLASVDPEKPGGDLYLPE